MVQQSNELEFQQTFIYRILILGYKCLSSLDVQQYILTMDIRKIIILLSLAQFIQACAAHCKDCNQSLNQCISCETLYDLSSNTCQISPLVYVVPVVAVSAISLILVIYCFYREKMASRVRAEQMLASGQSKCATVIKVLQYPAPQPNPSLFYNTRSIMLTSNREDQCSICLDKNCDLITLCKHHFHVQCFLKWVKITKSCPNCKNALSPFVNVLSCEQKRHFIEILFKQMLDKDFDTKIKIERTKGCAKCLEERSEQV